MKEKDLEIYDVFESSNGNLFIKMTEGYSIAIGSKGNHEPYKDWGDLDNTQYVKRNDVAEVERVGRIMFDGELRRKQVSFAEYCMTKLLSVTPEHSDMPEISGENLSKISAILREFKEQS